MAPSPIQILVVVGLILLLFGASRAAGIGRGLGEGIRNFRDALKGVGADEVKQLTSLGGDEKGSRAP